jgi:hypothetical protein
LRDLLTGIAIVVILALAGATIAPFFIDWDQRRDVIAEQLSAALGQPLEITGPIDLALLPVPTLKLAHVRFKDEGTLRGSVGRFRAELSIPPLMRGEIRVTEARVQGADIAIMPDAAGAGQSVMGSLPLASIGFDRLRIESSRFSVLRADGAAAIVAERLEGDLEATSLLGPVRGSLSFDLVGERRTLRLSTGRIEGASLRVRALLDNEAAAARTDFDGVLRLEAGQLAAEGGLAASGNAAIPLEAGTGHVIWRLAAKVKATGLAATLDGIELALGNTERQTTFTGSGDVDFSRGGAAARVILSTRQLDLDRLITGDDPRLQQTPEATVRSLLKAIADGPAVRPWLSGELEFSAGSLLFGGETVTAPRVTLRATGGGIGIGEIAGELPGRTQVVFQGAPTQDSAVAGRLMLDSADLARLAGWYQGSPPRALAIRRLRLGGDLRYGGGETSIRDAALVADEMRLNGTIRLETAASRPKLSLDLTADQLDIAKLPEVPAGDQASAWDLALAVNARRVRYAGVGAGDISLRLRKEGDATLLDDLTIRDLDGADLSARGSIGGSAPRLELRLVARRMEAILQLADRLSAHWGVPVLAQRAASLAPADLAMTWAAEGPENRRLAVKGKVGETAIDATLKVTPTGALAGADSLDIAFRAPSPAGLLRQLGVDAIPVASAGPVDMRLTGGGASARAPSIAWTLKGQFAGVRVDLDARQTTNLTEPLSGRIRLAARDAAPAAQTLLVAVPAIEPGRDLQLDAGFDLRGYRITLRDLDLRSGAQRIRGEIAFNLAEFGRVSGQLQMGRIDGSAIAPLIFGARGGPAAGPSWDRRPFGPAAAATLPGDLWIEAEALDLAGLAIGKPRFVLRFDNGLVFVEHAEGEWLDGRLAGQATLRRVDGAVSISGRLSLDNARIDRLPIPAASGLAGRAAAQLDFSAIGDSPSALIAASSGTGRLELRQGASIAIAPAPLDELLRTAPTDFASVTRESLTANLARRLPGRTPLPAAQAPLALATGVLRAGPLRIPTAAGETTLQAAVDLRDFTLNARAAFVSRETPRGWAGPTPAVEVVLRGPIGAPTREIDVSTLSNGLTAIAIQREQERIETLEQDQRERSFFNRRLRAAEEQRRAEEEERRRVEAERRAAEEARRRAEEEERRRIEAEARRRIEEERQRAADEERQRRAEELRRRAEEERRRVEDLQRREEERRRLAEDERRRRADDAAREEAERRARVDDLLRAGPGTFVFPPPPPPPPLAPASP